VSERDDHPGLDLRTATTSQVRDAMARGVREALIEHKRAGNPIVVWRDGRVLEVPPEEIVIPEEPPRPAAESRENV